MLSDARTRSVLVQALLVAALAGAFAITAWSTAANLKARGIPIGWDFFFQPAGFQIAETVLPYSPRDPYWWAAVVGLANTVFISILVIILSSAIGLLIGVGRLSVNPLVSGLSRLWVEIARNTPVVVLLIFIYSAWWKILPQTSEAWTFGPGMHLSLRGLVLPAVRWSGTSWLWTAPLFVAAASAVAMRIATRQQAVRGRRPAYAPLTFAGGFIALAIIIIIFRSDFSLEIATFRRSNYFGGWQLTPELTTILIGLTIYTAGFIGEIVRGGILAIGKGQWEAANSLGLSRAATYRLIIIPQALRAILPPLNSQYINVVKNSTLAIVVGYQDFMTVMGTVINKSSHAIEGIFTILIVFLTVNLALSALMNWQNRRAAIVER